jgi:hypothetical protein
LIQLGMSVLPVASPFAGVAPSLPARLRCFAGVISVGGGAQHQRESLEVHHADAVELGVVQILKDEYKISDVGDAACPEDQLVAPGVSFICIVEIGGVDKSVKITAKSDDGECEVSQPH